jgi:hypothetical protein
MNNKQLGIELKSIVANKADVTIAKGNISGASIEVRNTKTGEDLGSFTYYDRVEQRDTDFAKLETAINE